MLALTKELILEAKAQLFMAELECMLEHRECTALAGSWVEL